MLSETVNVFNRKEFADREKKIYNGCNHEGEYEPALTRC